MMGNLVTVVSKKPNESFFGIEAQHYTRLTPKLRKEIVNTPSLS